MVIVHKEDREVFRQLELGIDLIIAIILVHELFTNTARTAFRGFEDLISSLLAAARYMSSKLLRKSSMKRRLELMIWASSRNDTLNSSFDM
jgi:hypothetical protein